MFKKYSGKLFCFSPPVMLATFIIEIALALFTLWRYKLTALTRLVACMVILLAIFQLAEYMVCGGLGLDGIDWSRVGFVAITFLPALGVHIAHVLAGKKNIWLVGFSYLSAMAFSLYFAFATNALDGNVCQGNYVIFHLPQLATAIYSIFYYSFVLTGLGLSIWFARILQNERQRQALYGFAIGYASFLIPTSVINLLAPETLSGIPSIMCGFAVILALTVSLWVLPRVATLKKK